MNNLVGSYISRWSGEKSPPLHIGGPVGKGPAVPEKWWELRLLTLTHIIAGTTTTSMTSKRLWNPKHFVCTLVLNLHLKSMSSCTIIISILPMGIGGLEHLNIYSQSLEKKQT